MEYGWLPYPVPNIFNSEGKAMITIRAKGGLGNQLFQYATGYAMSKRLEQKMSIDTSFYPKQTLRGYKLDKLLIDSKVTISNEQNIKINILKSKYLNKLLRQVGWSIIRCGKNSTYMLECRSDLVEKFNEVKDDNIYIDGYYQSELYFKDYKKYLVEQFNPTYKPETEFLEELDKINKCNSIAVHVRRGDFLSAQNDPNPNHYLLGEQYYHNALKYVNECLENPVFFWFSDDIDWVKQNFGETENSRFVSLHTKHADIDEMMLMKNCKHIIAANSTFSWWASWLNEHEDALHICPAKRYGNLHMIPENWIKIAVE